MKDTPCLNLSMSYCIQLFEFKNYWLVNSLKNAIGSLAENRKKYQFIINELKLISRLFPRSQISSVLFLQWKKLYIFYKFIPFQEKQSKNCILNG
uniref:Uncharacterized protein n=1 Tax=Romanomermis culicivorax TaxID=13658 RepID=A0A915IHU0_ROMCU